MGGKGCERSKCGGHVWYSRRSRASLGRRGNAGMQECRNARRGEMSAGGAGQRCALCIGPISTRWIARALQSRLCVCADAKLTVSVPMSPPDRRNSRAPSASASDAHDRPLLFAGASAAIHVECTPRTHSRQWRRAANAVGERRRHSQARFGAPACFLLALLRPVTPGLWCG